MKKILYYSETSEFGGAEVALISLVKNIDRTKFEPVCFFRDGRHHNKISDALPGVKKYFVPMMLNYPAILYVLFKEKPDIVHLNMHVPFSCFFMIAAAKIFRVPMLISTVHSVAKPVSKMKALQIIKKGLAGLLLPLVNRFVCVSFNSKKELCSNYGLSEKSVDVVFSGIEPGETCVCGSDDARRDLGINESDMIIGSVTRLAKNKGVEDLLRVFSMLLQPHGNLRLIIVGEGELHSSLIRLANNLGIDDRVIFTGFRADVGKMVSLMDIFVQPSHSETFGLSIAEAMACGKAVVAFNVGGIPELVINKKTGFLAQPYDLEKMHDAINTLITDQDLRHQMGAAGRERALTVFTVERMAQQIEALYIETMAFRN